MIVLWPSGGSQTIFAYESITSSLKPVVTQHTNIQLENQDVLQRLFDSLHCLLGFSLQHLIPVLQVSTDLNAVISA